MRIWKELTADKKKEWNDKAKELSGEAVTKSANNNNTSEMSVKSDTTKNKLSSFAFQKT